MGTGLMASPERFVLDTQEKIGYSLYRIYLPQRRDRAIQKLLMDDFSAT
jgi:hypothetical protein